ncbi:hypothetical protein BT96DRAFT_945858 [Gymnopus androsaceus JB14]|uniref:Uncharacterized protein n=1 Tax=Gymnopus androsaceus JB14 TaxID=1447944 RepID=A0A6A4H0T3_9AGAR|nr:hypothetical protein BT96DRAFT_945858 [Gymnopus androsaceus JB14]
MFGINQWLMTGNQVIHELGGLEYPGQHYEDLAFTYKVDSKAAPESVKIAMFEAITKVNKIWLEPVSWYLNCKMPIDRPLDKRAQIGLEYIRKVGLDVGGFAPALGGSVHSLLDEL